MKKYVTEGIEEYLDKAPAPWHMPGHKRKPSKQKSVGIIDRALDLAQAVDVTEVPGTDDLYNPREIIKDSLNNLTEIYKTYASYYLVNGATCGILTAITACFRGNSGNSGNNRIIVARNCHKSVYNAVELLGLEPVYIYPDSLGKSDKYMPDIDGSIDPERVRKICENTQGIGAMVLTSPTYEGVISPVEAISNILKEYNIRLIVDEAHGAHLPFNEYAPESSIHKGADLVIHSLHKTMNSLTQTALLHVMKKEMDEDVRRYLGVYMTSSPSYLLMYSMERGIAKGIDENYNEYNQRLMEFRDRCKNLKFVRVLEKKSAKAAGAWDYDITRIVITTIFNKAGLENSRPGMWTNSYIAGTWLGFKLDKIGKLVVEMTGTDYAVLISTPADSVEDFEYLYRGLAILDSEIEAMCSNEKSNIKSNSLRNFVTESGLDTNAAKTISSDKILQLVGTKAIDNVYVYPPGSYILTRGEIITNTIARKLIEYVEQGKEIRGRLQ